MNNCPIILCHGLFGWVEGELPINYWGGIQKNKVLPTFEARIGPISSWHDRACEVIAQVKGLRVDYGADHSNIFGHNRYGADYSKKAFYPKWNAKNPIHMVGHSAGGNTMRMVQHLLATDHYKIGSNADWVKSISCISSVLNGTSAAYLLGCDTKTGLLKQHSLSFTFGNLLMLASQFQKKYSLDYDFELDHWNLSLSDDLTSNLKAIKNSNIFKSTDNLAYDLSIHGCYEFNGQVQSYPNTYYFGYATEQTRKIGSIYVPEIRMGNTLKLISALMGVFNYEKLNIGTQWGKGRLTNARWRSNDGLVPEISQYFPFINANIDHKIASSPGILNRRSFDSGIWYYENLTNSLGKSFDHVDIVYGKYLDPITIRSHEDFYINLVDRLKNLT